MEKLYDMIGNELDPEVLRSEFRSIGIDPDIVDANKGVILKCLLFHASRNVGSKPALAFRHAINIMTKIANQDFRGNRSNESVECFNGLQEIKKILGETT